ncbi:MULTISPECIES: hypothetical protein [Massilia]|uniref:Uncharacterized protein n=1 Tax=Massilia haematophila TaxID=457923 RepID=A0ABV7PGZ0_9BURK|nr:hypothetical protein [Massilia sp.]HBZ06420.1 hypothetical protein [Massilia sp.]
MKSFYKFAPLFASGIFTVMAAQAATPAYTIDTVIKDMSLANEAIPINPTYDWQYRPNMIQYEPSGASLPTWWTGNRPDWCYEALTWYTAFEAQGNKATNSRVEVRNLRMYVLSSKTGRWTRTNSVVAPYTDLWTYPFNYVGDMRISGARKEADGGYAIKPKYPNFHHGYGTSYTLSDPRDVRAVFVAMDFRLVVDNPKKADDRAKARYVVNAGADYYPGKGQDWSLGYAPGIGSGRYVLATNSWRTATLLVPNKNLGASMTEMRNNPPPLK